MNTDDNHKVLRASIQAALDRIDLDPTEGDLATAPLLDRWEVVRDAFDFTIMLGQVTGHPTLHGPAIRTSPLMRLNARAGWARTFIGRDDESLRPAPSALFRGSTMTRPGMTERLARLEAIMAEGMLDPTTGELLTARVLGRWRVVVSPFGFTAIWGDLMETPPSQRGTA